MIFELFSLIFDPTSKIYGFSFLTFSSWLEDEDEEELTSSLFAIVRHDQLLEVSLFWFIFQFEF